MKLNGATSVTLTLARRASAPLQSVNVLRRGSWSKLAWILLLLTDEVMFPAVAYLGEQERNQQAKHSTEAFLRHWTVDSHHTELMHAFHVMPVKDN